MPVVFEILRTAAKRLGRYSRGSLSAKLAVRPEWNLGNPESIVARQKKFLELNPRQLVCLVNSRRFEQWLASKAAPNAFARACPRHRDLLL